jgi:hypothetical protein
MSVGASLTEVVRAVRGNVKEAVRLGWDIQRVIQGEKKASILRYEETGGDPALGIRPRRVQVEGLNDLPVLVFRFRQSEIAASRGMLTEFDRKFVFYTEVRLSDEILFEGNLFGVYDLEHDSETGRSVVNAKMVR